MKMPLGTEVDLGPGHIVLDGVPAPRKRGTAAPLLWAHVYCGTVAHVSYRIRRIWRRHHWSKASIRRLEVDVILHVSVYSILLSSCCYLLL